MFYVSKKKWFFVRVIICILLTNKCISHTLNVDSNHSHSGTLKDQEVMKLYESLGIVTDVESLTTEELVHLASEVLHPQPIAVDSIGPEAFLLIINGLESETGVLSRRKLKLISIASRRYEAVSPYLKSNEIERLIDAIILATQNYKGVSLRGILTNLKDIPHPKIMEFAQTLADSEDYWVRERANSLLEAQNKALKETKNRVLNLKERQELKAREREPKPLPETSSIEADKPDSFQWWVVGILGVVVVLGFMLLKGKSK